MKKYLAVLALAGVLAACGGGSGSSSSADTSKGSSSTTSTTSDPSSDPNYAKGLALVSSNDCLTCHDIAAKKIGPAYVDVANKYAGVDTAENYLANKIINGGSGVWGSTPMTPHPALAVDSAKQIVKYIMLLKTAK